MCIGIQRYKIGIIYFKKIRAAKLKKWCVYVCGKKKGGGGGGGRTAYGSWKSNIISDFCFTSFETFFLDFKKFRIIFNYFYAQNRGVRFC